MIEETGTTAPADRLLPDVEVPGGSLPAVTKGISR